MTDPRFLKASDRLGRFVIQKRVGRGAMATVYRASDPTTGGCVAIKVLHEWQEGDQAAARLAREVALAQRIDHPGVCSVYSLQKEQGMVFLIMEYIEGETLDHLIDVEGRLTVPHTAHIIRAICEALAATHNIGIIHRDLKPGNIILRDDSTPVIVDFGYATGPNVPRLTATGAWVGTLQYMAPEELKAEKATTLSDVYSVGVIAYRCLTGKLPFHGVTFGEIASALLFRKPTPLTEHTPDLDPRLEKIVLKAMQRDPRKRYANIRELGSALAEFDSNAQRSALSRASRDNAPAAQSSTHKQVGLAAKAQDVGPADRTHAGAARPTLHAEYDQLKVELAEQRRIKGIISGDSATLDSLEKTAQLELGRGSWSAGVECLQLALVEIGGMAIDKQFITAKMRRLQTAMRDRISFRSATQLGHALEPVTRALRAGDLVKANRVLNQAFARLPSKSRRP